MELLNESKEMERVYEKQEEIKRIQEKINSYLISNEEEEEKVQELEMETSKQLEKLIEERNRKELDRNKLIRREIEA